MQSLHQIHWGAWRRVPRFLKVFLESEGHWRMRPKRVAATEVGCGALDFAPPGENLRKSISASGAKQAAWYVRSNRHPSEHREPQIQSRGAWGCSERGTTQTGEVSISWEIYTEVFCLHTHLSVDATLRATDQDLPHQIFRFSRNIVPPNSFHWIIPALRYETVGEQRWTTKYY